MLKSLRLKRNVVLLTLVIIMSVLLGGCSSVNGTLNTLSELYENKSITRENLMNISALRTGSVKVIKDVSKTPWEL